MTRKFWIAFGLAAIPIIILSAVSTAGARQDSFYVLWFIAGGLWLVSLLVSIPVVVRFYIRRELQPAAGVLAGMAVGLLALAGTCFANLTTVRF